MNQNEFQNTKNLPQLVSNNVLEAELVIDNKELVKLNKDVYQLVSIYAQLQNIHQSEIQRRYALDHQKNLILNNIYYYQNQVLQHINRNGLCLWKDKNTFYYRVDIDKQINDYNKKDISKVLSDNLHKDILLIDNITQINKNDLLLYKPIYIFTTSISNVEYRFNPSILFEFYLVDGIYYRNTFSYTPYLMHRINNNSNQYPLLSKFSGCLESYFYKIDHDYLLKRLSKFQLQFQREINPLEFKQPVFEMSDQNNKMLGEKSISITKFIFFLSKENNNVFNYIMNWLAYFFQKLVKSQVALVLMGDKRVSEEIFFSQIVEEIFGFTYCASITDSDLEEKSISQIVEDKIFFHIGDLSDKTSNDPKTKKLLRTILIDKIVKPDRTSQEQNKFTSIYGQTLITLHKPSAFIKDSYSKCTVVKVDDLENILIKLNLPDPASLDTMIKADLEDFSNILAQYPVHDQFANYALETEDRYPPVKTIDANTLDKNIQDFIDAIKSKKISYFEPIKAINSVLYDELRHNFDEGMIARQELFSYFDMLNPGSGFFDNKDFLAILRDKDPFFMQHIDNNKQYNKKKRYKIGIEVFE